MSPFLRPSRALLYCVLFASAFFIRAGEEPQPQPDGPPSKVLVRERTVYVPYEKLKETFEKEGRGGIEVGWARTYRRHLRRR